MPNKWGMGNLLHKDRADRPTATTDSTYGSESTSNAHDSYNSATTPSLTNSDASRNTNNTSVNDQGQTVTTTTTTTTTTTSGAGGSSQTSGPHTSNLANKLDPRVSSGSDQTEVSEVVQRREGDRPNVPAKGNMRERSPNPPPQQYSQQQQQHQPSTLQNLKESVRGVRDQRDSYGSPNNYEASNNYGSPTDASGRHNFSYPSRTPPNGAVAGASSTAGQRSQQEPSTLQNLKTAAVGIHGVGETLRGTLNSSVDKRFGGSPEQVAAHQQVVNNGREEIEGGRLSDRSRQTGGPGTKGILRKSGGNGQLKVVNE
ncbi:hypothetical protein MMC28_008989 [Mycoblastus sanguinarius]|nr:hypothetical protein [Mycoblastus sanguinarius]